MCSVFERTSYNIGFENHTFKISCALSRQLPENTIGQKIKKLRIRLGITQLQFAKSIKRGFGTVTKWEQELTTPNESTLNYIIDIYKLSTNYFNI